jgi:sirohydrochlorin ferrochelatase
VDKPVLLAVAHGSVTPGGSAAARAVIEQARAARPDVEVRLAFVDDEEPLAATALDRLGAEHRDVVVVPLLLHTGAHVRRDIPAALDAARAHHPGLRAVLTAPLGPDPRLARAAARRLAEAGIGTDDAGWSVVVAVAGSADPQAIIDVRATARLIGGVGSWQRVEPAYAAGGAHPTIEEALAGLHAGHATKVAVLPFVLGAGYFATVVRRAVEASPFAAGEVIVTAPLGDHEEIVQTLLDRYDSGSLVVTARSGQA